MDRTNETNPCAKCKTARAITTCHGCNESYCHRHFSHHRQELSLQMDTLGQNYDLFRRDLSDKTEEHPLIARINTWEDEAIKSIRKTAETARLELQKLITQIQSDLQTSIATTVLEIKDYRESDSYTEIELKRWANQLSELQTEFESPCHVSIDNNIQNETMIGLIKLSLPSQSCASSNIETSLAEQISDCSPPPPASPSPRRSFFLDEKFDVKTDAKLSTNQLTATCIPRYGSPGAILCGVNAYSTGIYDISFRIEKKGLSRLFFGIYSTQKRRPDAISSGEENSVYGWWDMDSSVTNGTREEGGVEQIISTGDKIVLTVDCENHQIQLYHIRNNQQKELAVDLNKCPFPWKMIVKLTANNDCLRIL